MATTTELRIRIPAYEEEGDDEFHLPAWPEYPEAASKDTVHAMDAEYIIRMVTLSDACRTLKRRATIAAAIFRFLYYRPALFSYAKFQAMVREKVLEYRGLIARGCFSHKFAEHLNWECERVLLSISWSTVELAD